MSPLQHFQEVGAILLSDFTSTLKMWEQMHFPTWEHSKDWRQNALSDFRPLLRCEAKWTFRLKKTYT